MSADQPPVVARRRTPKPVVLQPVPDTYESLVATAARELSQLRQQADASSDGSCWAQARLYVDYYQRIKAVEPNVKSHHINKDIKRTPNYQGPGSSFLSHALKTQQVFPEIFGVNTKNISYYELRVIANSRVTDKQALLDWWQDGPKTQRELRDEIRRLVGDDQARIGFRLMTSNMWRFASSDGVKDQDFDGGISDDLVANLLHYYTNPGEVIVDPMAGSGRTGQVVATLPYFRADWQDTEDHDNGGPRQVLMSDLVPTKPTIVQADATVAIPFEHADFILLDPPYWKVAERKYACMGDTIEEWKENLLAIARNCRSILAADGRVALILDDFLRSKQWVPLITLGARILEQAGFIHETSIYNTYNNGCATLDALGMWRVKKARMMVSGVKVINIFRINPHP